MKTNRVLILMTTVLFGMASYAQESASAAPSPFRQCAQQVGVTQGQKPTPEQKQALHACMKQAREAAFVQCAAASGVTLTPGEKPTPDQFQSIKQNHQAIHSCMVAAGFKKWKHHHRQNQNSQQSPSGSSTESPASPAAN